MTMPIHRDAFRHCSDGTAVQVVDGLPPALDHVADAGPSTHRFLRHGWFTAALAAYGGSARTVVVERDGEAVVALPLVAAGPPLLGILAVPGCYWPFRSFPGKDVGEAECAATLDMVATLARAVRIGPVLDGDPSVTALLAAARRRGWAVLDRFVANSFLLDMAALQADGGWPRGSTLRKNRFHEKHLAAHGTLDWSFLSGGDWPTGFAALASVEERSWIAERTDGRDAKFLDTGHGAFWRAAAADPVLAGMMRAALLRVDGEPAAFSFDLDAGTHRYAIANSYDPAFAKHSPGKLLGYRNLVEAIGRGVTTVDWGAGDAGYKRVIGADVGPPLRDWLLVRPGLAWAGRLAGPLWRNSGRRSDPDS